MKTITFLKTVPKDLKIDNDYRLEMNTHYSDILLSIDEILEWGFQRIDQEPFGEHKTLKFVYTIISRADVTSESAKKINQLKIL